MRFRRGRRCQIEARRRMFTGLRRSLGWRRELPGVVGEMLTGADACRDSEGWGWDFCAVSHGVVLLDSGSLEEAAAVRARELGWHVEIDNRCDDWSAERAATYLLERLRELRQWRARVCLLSAGEVTVQVPAGSAGRGGRNQHFALVCSEALRGVRLRF